MGNLKNMQKLKEMLQTKSFDYVVINPIYKKDWRGQKSETGQYVLNGSHKELNQIEVVETQDYFQLRFLTLVDKLYFSENFSFEELFTFLERDIDFKKIKTLREKKEEEIRLENHQKIAETEKKEKEIQAVKEKMLAEKENRKKAFLSYINMFYKTNENTYEISYETDTGLSGKISVDYKELVIDAPFGSVSFETIEDLKEFRRAVRSKLL